MGRESAAREARCDHLYVWCTKRDRTLHIRTTRNRDEVESGSHHRSDIGQPPSPMLSNAARGDDTGASCIELGEQLAPGLYILHSVQWTNTTPEEYQTLEAPLSRATAKKKLSQCDQFLCRILASFLVQTAHFRRATVWQCGRSRASPYGSREPSTLDRGYIGLNITTASARARPH
jgi:hypothetical protein